MRRRVCVYENELRAQERQASLQSLQKVKPIKLNYIPDVHVRTSRKFNQRRSLRNYKTCKNTFLGFSLASLPRPQIRFPSAEEFLEREKVAPVSNKIERKLEPPEYGLRFA